MTAVAPPSAQTSPSSARSTMHELVGPAGAPVVLALGGISAHRHVAQSAADPSPGWWDGVVGPGRAIDTTSRRVLGIDYADGGRAANGRPASIVTTREQAERVVALLDQQGIDRLDAVIGASYGGMVALALAQYWPDRVRRIVVIGAAHESHPMATGLRAIQRRIVELGLDTGKSSDAMALARAVAMTTYRTAREFTERFDVHPDIVDGTVEFDVERYLVHAGQRFAERMPPERFLALSLSADLHRVVPEHIDVPTTVIAAQGDTLVPPLQMRAMARRLPQLAQFATLRTRYGHDAFLIEPAKVGRLLTSALAD